MLLVFSAWQSNRLYIEETIQKVSVLAKSLSLALWHFCDRVMCLLSTTSPLFSSSIHGYLWRWDPATAPCFHLLAFWFLAYTHITATSLFRQCVLCCSICCCWRRCVAFVMQAGLAGLHHSFHKLFVNWRHKWIHGLSCLCSCQHSASCYFWLFYEHAVHSAVLGMLRNWHLNEGWQDFHSYCCTADVLIAVGNRLQWSADWSTGSTSGVSGRQNSASSSPSSFIDSSSIGTADVLITVGNRSQWSADCVNGAMSPSLWQHFFYKKRYKFS